MTHLKLTFYVKCDTHFYDTQPLIDISSTNNHKPTNGKCEKQDSSSPGSPKKKPKPIEISHRLYCSIIKRTKTDTQQTSRQIDKTN